jgi:glycosyltransferase involved in cell wall biosynthesis
MNFDMDFSAILGDFDPSAPPPRIAPVPEGIHRPRWSVMIPTYNCAKYLRQTLESVLAQDPGPDQMQIEVIDDCSTKDDPEAVVREIGQGRAAFYRKSKNEGASPNFNTCIERSRGELVHILHGDDFVMPGFYRAIQAAAVAHRDISAFFTRCFIVDEWGRLDGLSPRIPELEAGSRYALELELRNIVYTPGVVIRRRLYEDFGGFLVALVHLADWEMRLRGTRRGGALFLNEAFASYRSFPGNDTGRLARSGEILRDHLRFFMIRERRGDSPDAKEFLVMFQGLARYLISKVEAAGDLEGADNNRRILEQVVPKPGFATRLIAGLRSFKHHLSGR